MDTESINPLPLVAELITYPMRDNENKPQYPGDDDVVTGGVGEEILVMKDGRFSYICHGLFKPKDIDKKPLLPFSRQKRVVASALLIRPFIITVFADGSPTSPDSGIKHWKVMLCLRANLPEEGESEFESKMERFVQDMCESISAIAEKTSEPLGPDTILSRKSLTTDDIWAILKPAITNLIQGIVDREVEDRRGRPTWEIIKQIEAKLQNVPEFQSISEEHGLKLLSISLRCETTN